MAAHKILQNKILLTIIIWEFEPEVKIFFADFAKTSESYVTCGQHRQITNIFLSMELKVICEYYQLSPFFIGWFLNKKRSTGVCDKILHSQLYLSP